MCVCVCLCVCVCVCEHVCVSAHVCAHTYVQLDSVNTTKHELHFQYGGWQEARGGNAGKNHYYAENIAEELDSPGEWFLDTDTSTLYFYPNATQCADLQHAEVVAPQHSSLVQLRGSGSSRPVRNIHFAGLTFTETRTTFLDY